MNFASIPVMSVQSLFLSHDTMDLVPYDRTWKQVDTQDQANRQDAAEENVPVQKTNNWTGLSAWPN